MGMTIDKAINHGQEQLEIFGGEHRDFIETAIDTMRKYQQLQADYENRLKADMVAMLTEIQLEIEEHTMTSGVTNQSTWNECIACCSRVIQQKIDALKEIKDDKYKPLEKNK